MRRYFEFAIVVIVVSVLALVLMRALGEAKRNMEEAGVQAEAAAIRAQLLEAVAHREAFGGRLPATDNPLDWVGNRPPNYVGEHAARPAERGIWYFDKNDKSLVYVYQDGDTARFRLSRNAGVTGSRGVVAGIGLLRLDEKSEQSLRK